MHLLRKTIGCLLYVTLAVFLFCYIVYTHFGENVIRKFLHDYWDSSIEVDWDALPFTDEELLRYQNGIQVDDG